MVTIIAFILLIVALIIVTIVELWPELIMASEEISAITGFNPVFCRRILIVNGLNVQKTIWYILNYEVNKDSISYFRKQLHYWRNYPTDYNKQQLIKAWKPEAKI